MALFEIIFFIVFPFLFLSLQPSTSVEICPIACGHQSIRFPFRLNSQPEHCGYPRFNLSCRHDTQTILTLPFSGDFIVQLDIDYLFQIIWIDDPDNCIARRLLKGLNFSGTPFKLLDPENYLFLNCRHDVTTHIPRMIYISCLGGDSFSVVAVPAESFYMNPSLWSCAKMATVSMPALDPNYGMSLTWNEPDCMSCERRAGTCTFKSSTSLDIGCFGGFSTGLSKGTKYIIAFGVGIPLLCILWLVFYLHRKANNYNNIHHHRHLNPEISIPVAPRRLDADAKGLDRPTIDTYPITLLGECRRLPNPKDNTCSICLCEYQAKEALRTIPDCKHYFHVSCIDEWLKLNASCPLCRYVAEGSASSSFSSQ